MVLNFLSTVKDKAISFAVEKGANFFDDFTRYGKMLQFDIDTNNKTLFAKVELDGENEPLSIDIKKYNIQQENDKYFITIIQMECSKKWLNTLIADFVINEKFEIPTEYIKYLSMFKLI